MKITRKEIVSRGSALIMTLLAMAMLTIIAVTFLLSMKMGRINSRSYYDMQQAQFAAEGGLETAMAQIRVATETNPSFVTGLVDDPNHPGDKNYQVTAIGRRDLKDTTQLMPLVSGPLELLKDFNTPPLATPWANFSSYLTDRQNTDKTLDKSVDINTARNFIQVLSSSSSLKPFYRAIWVTLENKTGTKTTYSRFAYIVLDEQARLNPRLHKGTGTGLTSPTDWVTGPEDIKLTKQLQEGTSTQDAIPALLTEDQMKKITDSPASFRYSGDTLGQIFDATSTLSARDNYELVKHLYTSQANATFDFIPGWLPEGKKADGTPTGKQKYNLNELATNTKYGATAEDRAKNIVKIINDNLPDFGKRDPAYRSTTPTTYLNRLAANIVDYIDNDDLGSGAVFTKVSGEPSGQEATVFPTGFAQRMRCSSGGYELGNNHTSATIENQWFASVWNPYTKPVTIQSARISITNRPYYWFGASLQLRLPNYIRNTITPLPKTIKPGEFAVLAFPTSAVGTVSSPTATENGPQVEATPINDFIQYEFKVNDQVVSSNLDKTKGGLEQNRIHRYSDVTRLDGTTNNWNCSFLNNKGTKVADPRFGNFYQTVWQGVVSKNEYITKAFWNGRRAAGAGATGGQDLKTQWLMRDHMPRDPSTGLSPGAANVTPDQVPTTAYQPTDASTAPGVLRDGPMISLGELGHIFDPAHAADDLSTANTGSGDAGYTSVYQNGGGRTLRIGQPESKGSGADNWDTDTKRAINLLDLFTIDPEDPTGASKGALGRINPNTASSEVLASLFSGIQLNSDPDMADGARTITNAKRLADLMIENRPYSCLSDLHKFLDAMYKDTEITNFKPSIPIYSASGTSYWDESDRVREETFGKLIQHLAIQSRTYRIYVIGQALDYKKKPIGSSVIEATINLKQDPTSGLLTPEIQYVRNLQ